MHAYICVSSHFDLQCTRTENEAETENNVFRAVCLRDLKDMMLMARNSLTL